MVHDPLAMPRAISNVHVKSARALISPSDLIKEPRIVDHYRRLIESKMAGLPSYETVKKFRLLPSELTLEEGELTPTMKVKRRIIEAKYSDLIASMYNE